MANLKRAADYFKNSIGLMKNNVVLLKGKAEGCEYYRFITNGSNPCKKCAELCGKELKISEAVAGENFPPLHPNCRCEVEITSLSATTTPPVTTTPPPVKRGPYIPPSDYLPPPKQWNMAPGSIPLPPGYVHPPFSPRRTFFETRIIEQFEYNWLEVSEHVTIEFLSRITEISKSLQINPDHLMHVIDFETGGTFSPSQRNIWGSGATGLIKFMPETAEFLGTTTDALTNMSAVEQLDFVYEHLKPHSGNMNTLNDVYMAVLWPIAVGRSDDSVLWREGSGQYTANSSLDLNGDGVITKAEATQRVINHRNDFNRIERLG